MTKKEMLEEITKVANLNNIEKVAVIGAGIRRAKQNIENCYAFAKNHNTEQDAKFALSVLTGFQFN